MYGLNVVALISGGKDSLFSILHCQANGHNVVALANLHPPHVDTGAVDDLESYMYQTIGHTVIPLYEQALGLPLYRQEIVGDAVIRDKCYGPKSAEDETESLLPLLRKVLVKHPEVNAVSTGAILSDYQRTRVESVALRLGLTPLSYLWQWPSLAPASQTSLLEDMAAAKQDSRIIKVASGGLDDSFLWQNVAEKRTIARLTKAANRFGSAGDGAVLGEGGEYETLAVSGPAPLWKGRIEVPSEGVQAVIGEGGSASVRINQAKVVTAEKDDIEGGQLRVPPILDSRFQDILQSLTSPSPEAALSGNTISATVLDTAAQDDPNACLRLPNLVGAGKDAASQTGSIMDQIAASLKKAGHTFSDIAYTIIIVRNMDDFAAVNAAYGEYFKEPNPPARLTIACADVLPPDALLGISITSIRGPRQGLHVQSRSYWAPANIGPYSQAIALPDDAILPSCIRGSVYIAGQIPLIPTIMHLPAEGFSNASEEFALQSVLALQHLARIGKVMNVRRWTFGIAFLAKAADDDTPLQQREQIVQSTWQAFHCPPVAANTDLPDDAEDFDIWNITHGSTSKPWLLTETANDREVDASANEVPSLKIFEVDSLPRGSSIEWIGFGQTTAGDVTPSPLHLQSLLETFHGRRTRAVA